jgi:hypothetical protein
MSSPSAKPKCTLCNLTVATTLCSGCGSARYCSKQCRENDFPYHQALCGKYRAFAKGINNPRPSPDAKVAVFFSQHKPNPTLIWLEQTPDRKFNLVSCFPLHFIWLCLTVPQTMKPSLLLEDNNAERVDLVWGKESINKVRSIIDVTTDLERPRRQPMDHTIRIQSLGLQPKPAPATPSPPSKSTSVLGKRKRTGKDIKLDPGDDEKKPLLRHVPVLL